MAWEAVWTNQLGALTLAQQTNNSNIIYYHFHDQGWEDMPIAAMLGNMHIESQMNPAQWDIQTVIRAAGGIQRTHHNVEIIGAVAFRINHGLRMILRI